MRLPVVERWLRVINPGSVLEAGAGAGAMAYRLASRYDYRGYEPDPTSYRVAASRLAALGRGEVFNREVPIEPDRPFDLLVAFEVLEHIETDLDALVSWARWLSPGGTAILSVPANPERFGPCDQLVGHYRRYTRESLQQLIVDAGFDVMATVAWGMPFGYALEAVRNRLASRRLDRGDVGTGGSGRLFQPPAGLGRAVELMMRPVSALQMPFGGSDRGVGYVAVGRLRQP